MASEKMGVGVNYEVMMGRDSLEDERLDDDHDQILIGDELILDVKDWKPNKVTNQSSGPAWVDPKKDPRFGKEKKPDYTGDDDAVNINYEYLKPREGLHVLNMQNLPDRWINETDNEIVKNEIYETDKVERKKNILDAIDEDNQILKGEEMQSSKKRSTNFVNMKQQLNRPVNINKTDAPDILYEVKDVNKEREDIGVRNWDLVPGRESKIITKERIQSNVPEANSDDEEVIVSPKKAALSR